MTDDEEKPMKKIGDTLNDFVTVLNDAAMRAKFFEENPEVAVKITKRSERAMDPNDPIQGISPDALQTLADLEKWLAALPNQKNGKRGPETETGEPYVEFQRYALARPNDVAIIERDVANDLGMKIQGYLRDHFEDGSVIYWRRPFEWDIIDHQEVIRYVDIGPDEDIRTGRKCVMDKNWRCIKAYARLCCCEPPERR
jgi:hypothetical protein